MDADRRRRPAHEAPGGDGGIAPAGRVLRLLAILALVAFVVVFSATYGRPPI